MCCCLDIFDELQKNNNFYNFNNKTPELEEIIIVKNDNSIIRQPLFTNNKRFNDENLTGKYKSQKIHKIPKIIIEDTEEEIIYNKNITRKKINNNIITNKLKNIMMDQIFIDRLNDIIINKINNFRKDKIKYKKDIIENFLITKKDELKFENLTNQIRNRKNKIEKIDNEEWNIIE